MVSQSDSALNKKNPISFPDLMSLDKGLTNLGENISPPQSKEIKTDSFSDLKNKSQKEKGTTREDQLRQ